MTAAQKNLSPLPYVEAVERKRLNFACEQGGPYKKMGAVPQRSATEQCPRGLRSNDKESH